MWVIYNTTTRDHPGRWVVRLHTSLPEPEATTLSMVRDSLKAAREALPYGLTCIGRSPDDDPVIYEVWL